MSSTGETLSPTKPLLEREGRVETWVLPVLENTSTPIVLTKQLTLPKQSSSPATRTHPEQGHSSWLQSCLRSDYESSGYFFVPL